MTAQEKTPPWVGGELTVQGVQVPGVGEEHGTHTHILYVPDGVQSGGESQADQGKELHVNRGQGGAHRKGDI